MGCSNIKKVNALDCMNRAQYEDVIGKSKLLIYIFSKPLINQHASNDLFRFGLEKRE